jgi:hypothetical protein
MERAADAAQMQNAQEKSGGLAQEVKRLDESKGDIKCYC